MTCKQIEILKCAHINLIIIIIMIIIIIIIICNTSYLDI